MNVLTKIRYIRHMMWLTKILNSKKVRRQYKHEITKEEYLNRK